MCKVPLPLRNTLPWMQQAPLLDKLNTDITAVLRMPEIHQRLDELVMEATPTRREAFDQFIRAENALWARVIKETRIAQQLRCCSIAIINSGIRVRRV